MSNASDPNSAEFAALAQVAGSPLTPAQHLADLAYQYPQLRAIIAANPTSYPGLIDWLAGLGDAEVNQAIASRGGGAPSAPQSYPSQGYGAPAQPTQAYPTQSYGVPAQPTQAYPTSAQPTEAFPAQAQPTEAFGAVPVSPFGAAPASPFGAAPSAGVPQQSFPGAQTAAAGAYATAVAAPLAAGYPNGPGGPGGPGYPGYPAAAGEPKKPRKKLIVGLSIGLVGVLALTAGGVFAFNSFMSGGFSSATESAKAFPATTVSWTEVALDPAPGQKLEMLQVVKNLPGLKDYLDEFGPDIDYDNPDSSTDLREKMWEFFFENPDFDTKSSLDYQDDIKPWVGDRAAFGIVGSAASMDEAYYVAIATKDAQKSIDAVTAFVKENDVTGVQVSHRSGYVIITNDALDLDKAFEKGTLADTESMKAASGKLGSWGLAASWSSPRAALDAQIAWLDSDDDAGLNTLLERYEDEYTTWKDEVDAWDEDCSGSNSSYSCTFSEPLSEDEYYDIYGYYPKDWKKAAEKEHDENKSARADSLKGYTELAEKVSPNGSVSGAIRFADAGIEMTGFHTKLELPAFEAAKNSEKLGKLPESTVIAGSFSQLGSVVDTVLSPEYFAVGAALTAQQLLPLMLSSSTFGDTLPQFDSDINTDIDSIVKDARSSLDDSLQETLGLGLPEGLDVLLGNNLIFAADKNLGCDSSELFSGSCENVGIGVLIYSDSPEDTKDTAKDLLGTAEDGTGMNFDIDSSGNRVALGLGNYVDTLLEEKGNLGGTKRFSNALPNLNSSFASLYVDIDSLIDIAEEQTSAAGYPLGDSLTYLEGLESFGFTASQSGSGDVSSMIKITTKSTK